MAIRASLSVMLVWFAAPLSPACAGPNPTATIPFVREDTRVYIEVYSSGKSLGWFILDTGSSTTLIEKSLEARLRLAPLATLMGHGAGTNALTMTKLRGPVLSIGALQFHPKTVLMATIANVLAPYSGRVISGIIGGDFFQDHVVELDPVQKVIRVGDAASARRSVRGIVVPFAFIGGVPIAKGRVRMPDRDWLSLRMMLDLGAKADLLLAEPFVQKNRLLDRLTPSVIEPLGAGLGGETHYAFARIPEFDVGPHDELAAKKTIVGLSVGHTLRGGNYDALLGFGFLGRFPLTIDYPNRRFVFGPAVLPPDIPDRSGVFLVAQPDLHHFIIHYVARNSPAELSGLRAGDEVIAVGGKPASRYSLSGLRHYLNYNPGRTVNLEIRRTTKTLSKELALRDPF